MFKVVVTLFFVAVTLGMGLLIFPISEKDRETFNDLLKSSNPDTNDDILSYSQQKREKVRKEIWYQDDSPLYFCIDSAESELFFFKQENQIEVVEQLADVSCVMQEELYYVAGKPMQKIRYLEAEKACYNYTSNLFIAEDVKLWNYQLEGHIPPKDLSSLEASMRATAHSVEFTLKGKKLDFTAHKMRAVVNQEKVL